MPSEIKDFTGTEHGTFVCTGRARFYNRWKMRCKVCGLVEEWRPRALLGLKKAKACRGCERIARIAEEESGVHEVVPKKKGVNTRKPKPTGATSPVVLNVKNELLTLVENDRENEEYRYPEGVERPKTRGECAGGARPCPFVSCKFHLYLDVTKTGSIRITDPSKEVWEMEETCALDVADRGGQSLSEVGNIINTTNERVRMLEFKALRRLRIASAVSTSAIRVLRELKDDGHEVVKNIKPEEDVWVETKTPLRRGPKRHRSAPTGGGEE